METTDAIVDLEDRYRELLADVRRPLVTFVEVSLRYGRFLAEVDLERARTVLRGAMEALHDPPAPSELALAVDLLEAVEVVAARLGDVDGQLVALGRLQRARASAGSVPIVIDLRRRSSNVLAASGRTDAAAAELDDALRDADAHGVLRTFTQLVADLVVLVSGADAGAEALAGLETTLARIRGEHRTRERAAEEPSAEAARDAGAARDDDTEWVRWSLIGLAALRVAADDPSSTRLYLRRLSQLSEHRVLPALAGVVMAQAAWVDGDARTAALLAQRMVGQTEADPRLRRLSHALVGQALAALGDAAAARVELDAALEVAGPSADRVELAVRRALAGLDADAGDFAAAYAHLAVVVSASASVPAAEATVDLRGATASAEHVARPVVDPDVLSRMVELESMIEERTRALDAAERRLRDLDDQLALDPLTGLLGREQLRDELGARLARGSSLAVLSLDLDRFALVNDSFGHGAGDALLVEVARRLGDALGPSDLVARWGGDEFMVLVDGVAARPAARAFGEALRQAVQAPWDDPAVVPAEWLGRLAPSVSMGVAVGRGGEVSADELLRQADAAAGSAKRTRTGVELFGGALGDHSRRRLAAEALVRGALDHDWFELHYQPIYANATGRPEAAEALLRIRHPERGLIPPLEFLDAIEEVGLGAMVGRWVVATACAALARWSELRPGFRVAVNVAPALLDLELPEVVAAAARRHGADPASLIVELTEHTLLEADDRQVATLVALRELGVRIALDDFGTSFSSLCHLRRFPVDVVKVDRSFVAGIAHHPHDAAIVRAIVGLSHELGFRVIAEGVESVEQLDVQRRLGCFGAQGFLLGRPDHEASITTTLATEPPFEAASEPVARPTV